MLCGRQSGESSGRQSGESSEWTGVCLIKGSSERPPKLTEQSLYFQRNAVALSLAEQEPL